MELLRNFDFAKKYYDCESKVEINETSNVKIFGWYKFINEKLSGLLVTNNNLYFLYGDNKFLITDSHKVSLKKINNEENEFKLVNNDTTEAKFLYFVPNHKHVSPFEYIDEEDFKWGDFIAKIINDGERKNNFISNLMEP